MPWNLALKTIQESADSHDSAILYKIGHISQRRTADGIFMLDIELVNKIDGKTNISRPIDFEYNEMPMDIRGTGFDQNLDYRDLHFIYRPLRRGGYAFANARLDAVFNDDLLLKTVNNDSIIKAGFYTGGAVNITRIRIQRSQEIAEARGHIPQIINIANNESNETYYQYLDGNPQNVIAITNYLSNNLVYGAGVIFQAFEASDIRLNVEYYKLSNSIEKKAYAIEFITNIYVLFQKNHLNTYNSIWTKVTPIFAGLGLDLNRLKHKGAPY
jgi:hypothetical protein